MRKTLKKISLKLSISKLGTRYLVFVLIALFLLCLALGSALKSSFQVRELISQRQNFSETNDIIYSLLIDLGHEDIFINSEDNKFKETKNLSIYQLTKILNSYTKQLKNEEQTEFNNLAKKYVETPVAKRKNISYSLQLEAKKILSKLRDKIYNIKAEIEAEMKNIISTVTFLLSFAAIFMIFSILYNFVERKKWNELIEQTNAAKKNAENLSNIKSQFLATVSHEVRTPLNGIIATAEVLATNTSLEHEAHSMCSIIQSSGNTLLRIINDILDYSKIESGNIQFNFENFNISKLINEIIQANKHRAHKKNIDLKVIFKNLKFENIKMDRDRLAQVLYNVLGNAIKFTDKGSVTLIVETLDDLKNTYLQLTVKDTGIGIADDQKDKVFVPFIQIQSQGTSGEPGSGLGLSISKKIVDKLNGELTFDSISGLGTEFKILLPVENGFNNESVENKNELILQIWNPINSAIQKHIDSTQKIIFIAEDNPTNQIVISTMLNHQNVRNVLFSNGKELIDALESNLPRFILMDCQMPVMDGYNATTVIKKIHPNLPIIAMTADATEQNQQLCKNKGFDGILIKPLNIAVVNDLLNQYKIELKEVSKITEVDTKSSISDAVKSLDEKFGIRNRVKILNSFVEQINHLDSEILEKIQDKNLEGLKQIGHKFKSSSQIVGAKDFYTLFHSLEKSEDLTASEKLTKDILIEKIKVVKIIENYVAL